MRNITRTLLMMLLPLLGVAQEKPEAMRQAYTYFDSGKYELALKELDLLVKKDPSQADYYDLRGEVKAKLNMYQDAFNDISMAISIKPRDPLYYHHRAVLLYATQNPDMAIEDNDMALKFVKSDSLKYSIISNRGSCRAMKRDFQGAYDDYMAAFQFDSTNVGTLTNLGAVLDELKRGDEAIHYLEMAIRLRPDFVGGYGNLAFRYSNKGDYIKALELNNKVLELDPDEPLGYNNRGFVKYKLNDLKGALEDINRSLAMYPQNSFAYKNRALVYIAMKKTGKACDDIKKALELNFTSMYGDEVEGLKKQYCK